MEWCHCVDCFIRVLSERDASDAEADRAEEELTRLRAELAEARALVEKRGRAIVWIFDADVRTSGEAIYWFEGQAGEHQRILHDGTRAGLLAAVDEATKGVG